MAISLQASLNIPFLGQPVEICIVTPNIKDTITGLVKLGIGPFKIYRFSPSTVTEQTINGKSEPFEIKVAFAEQGKMIWEIMQPVSGSTVMQDFLQSTNGKGGIHHVAFDCKDGDPRSEKILQGQEKQREWKRSVDGESSRGEVSAWRRVGSGMARKGPTIGRIRAMLIPSRNLNQTV